MKLHHVGVVVENLATHGEACSKFLQMSPDSSIYDDPIQKVRIQLWKDESGNILELIEPAAPDSPVWGALRKGGGLNHLCFEVDNIEEHVRLASEQGGIPAGGIVPAVAFSGRRVAFMFLPKMNLVEFVEAER